jgi:hypothetical protein
MPARPLLRTAFLALIAALAAAGCARKASEVPRETSRDTQAREPARSGDGDVAEDYADVGEATSRVHAVGSPAPSTRQSSESPRDAAGAGVQATSLSDHLTAHRPADR